MAFGHRRFPRLSRRMPPRRGSTSARFTRGDLRSHRPAHPNRKRRKQRRIPMRDIALVSHIRHPVCGLSRWTGRAPTRRPDWAVPAGRALRELPYTVRIPVRITARNAFPEKRQGPSTTPARRDSPTSATAAPITTSVRFVFGQQFNPQPFSPRYPGPERTHEIKEAGGISLGRELRFRFRCRSAAEECAHVHDHHLVRIRQRALPERRLRYFYQPYRPRDRLRTRGARRQVTAGPQGRWGHAADSAGAVRRGGRGTAVPRSRAVTGPEPNGRYAIRGRSLMARRVGGD